MGKTEGVIKAKFKNHEGLEEFVNCYKGETGREPVDIDGVFLVVEVDVSSYGEREVLKEFLLERGAEILLDEIDDGES